MEYAGINETKEKLLEKFEIIETKDPYKIFDDVWYLGQIHRKFDVPIKNLPTALKNGEVDYIYDDSGIAIKTENGIVVLGSCSHSGIDNIIEQAKKVTGINRVIAVIGGFHLKEINPYTEKIVQYFKQNQVQNAFMGHCTSNEVIDYFEKQLKDCTNVKRMFVGLVFEIN